MVNNLNNANKEFQNIIDCDFNKSWSWDILHKNLAILEQINKLPKDAYVLEIGAANSYLKDYTENNLNRSDINFIRVDVNPVYKDDLIIHDVTQGILWDEMDLIIISEVVEHFPSSRFVSPVIKGIYEALKEGAIMVLTTPTVIRNLDDLVWPGDHKYEFTFKEIYQLVNKYFEIERVLPWSMKERDYNEYLETNALATSVYMKLRGKMPESYIRSVISLLAPDSMARQTMLICKKRRMPNA